MSGVLDCFDERQNSSIWPSDDPNDSPSNTFICKLCGWEFDSVVYGEFPIEVNPYNAVRNKIVDHLRDRHQIFVRR